MSVKGIGEGIINDRMPVYGPLSSVCTFCKHWIEDAEQHCKAYKESFSIPLEIWTGENRHLKKFKGDHGIQFEELDEEREKSPLHQATESLRNELQNVFPESNVSTKGEEV